MIPDLIGLAWVSDESRSFHSSYLSLTMLSSCSFISPSAPGCLHAAKKIATTKATNKKRKGKKCILGFTIERLRKFIQRHLEHSQRLLDFPVFTSTNRQPKPIRSFVGTERIKRHDGQLGFFQ